MVIFYARISLEEFLMGGLLNMYWPSQLRSLKFVNKENIWIICFSLFKVQNFGAKLELRYALICLNPTHITIKPEIHIDCTPYHDASHRLKAQT